MQKQIQNKEAGYAPKFKKEAIEDFKTACLSREASLLGRREVLGGKAKFGIFGDGKEVAQVAMARAFKNGDFRSGYYRDQTFVFAAGLGTVEQFFSQLYADVANDPFSAGRQMNAHFATPLVDESGQWLPQTTTKNISADISPTAGQMARALGLAAASKQYRARLKADKNLTESFANFSQKGNEVSFCTIGDASTSEGVFWETINAAGVTQVPLAVFVWDDGYGISVPIKYQTTKSSISAALSGMQSDDNTGQGIEIRRVKAWDYADLRRVFADGIEDCRANHAPYLFHVQEVTQPQGHSTSGSHERYKSAERLLWEKEQDGIVKMRQWLLSENILTEAEATEIESEAKKEVKAAARRALDKFNAPIAARKAELLAFVDALLSQNIAAQNIAALTDFRKEAAALHNPTNRDILRLARLILRAVRSESAQIVADLQNWLQDQMAKADYDYTSHLYSENEFAAAAVTEIKPNFNTENTEYKNGFEILNNYFDQLFETHPEVVAFGEDVGQIGDVNQGFAGLQAKHGETRIFDAGIREWTIIGQAIGMAMRGLRPIAEIQYLDYLIYALSPLSDDLATIRYRSAGIQQAPAIIRTRGHRLEGIWHSGSPIGMMLHSLRGICLLVPRDMTRAVGFYNTMLRSNDPAIIIECLNGYRLKEQLPTNLLDFTVPVGVVECLQTGSDVTLVTYGSCVRVAQEAAADLEKLGISVEIIDCQSLLPFDIAKDIAKSLAKTNRLVVLDEDVPSGGAAYILDKVINEQKGYFSLDAQPLLITAKAVRPAYGSDADYIIKPSTEDVVEQVYALMHEARPADFAPIYR
jgi:pyruvate/2-oxoglutarate/acetoin dehydrogenase E1 component/TPP-dependent pyruvate/acetoin dehydrogenase alpha subunit